MGNMKFGIFQNADWGLGGLVRFVGFVDSWDGGMVGWKRTKSRLRRKKTAPIANSGASCVSRVVYSYLWILATTDPPRLIALISLSPSCASGFAFRLHGVFHDMPSPMALLLWVWVWRGWGKRWRGMRVFGVLISRHGIGWLGCRYFTICFLPWKM